MTLTLSLLISSLLINVLLILRLMLMKADMKQNKLQYNGALVEKARLRNIIKTLKIHQN
jgi:hypothetical protein